MARPGLGARHVRAIEVCFAPSLQLLDSGEQFKNFSAKLLGENVPSYPLCH